MARLIKLLREDIEQRKRKVYLKAVIDMATAYSRRGYTQQEAIKDAAKSIENTYGYVLTPLDIEAVKHFVPENPQFKEDAKLEEEISRDEALRDVDSVQTLVDGKRGVAFITRGGNSSQDWEAIRNMVDTSDLKTMHVKGNEYDAYIVYVQGYANDATELKNIAEKYGGYLHVEATAAETRRIGELLGYKKDEIDAYIKKWYPRDLNNEALDVSWNPYEETNYKYKFKEEELVTLTHADDDTRPLKILDRCPTYNDIEVDFRTADIADLDYSNDPDIWEEDENSPWYLIPTYYSYDDDEEEEGIPLWWPESVLVKYQGAGALEEALDVSWNPYEETQYRFKVGDTVPLEFSDGSVKILDRRSSLGDDMQTSELDYGAYGSNHEAYWNYDEDNPWYLFVHPEYEEEGPLWFPQSDFIGYDEVDVEDDNQLGDIDEALDVSWNPFEALSSKFTNNTWLKLKIGSRGEFEDASFEEIPNIKKHLIARKKVAYQDLLNYLKNDPDLDKEEKRDEIAYFKEFTGPYQLDDNNLDQWGYGMGEEDEEQYYRILSDRYSQWGKEMTAKYGVDFVDDITWEDIDQLEDL